MTDNRIRLLKHEAVPGCGSYEVRFADGQESVFFYWDDNPRRRMRAEQLTGKQAFDQARAMARVEHAKG